jgi:hypothetical protein
MSKDASSRLSSARPICSEEHGLVIGLPEAFSPQEGTMGTIIVTRRDSLNALDIDTSMVWILAKRI